MACSSKRPFSRSLILLGSLLLLITSVSLIYFANLNSGINRGLQSPLELGKENVQFVIPVATDDNAHVGNFIERNTSLLSATEATPGDEPRNVFDSQNSNEENEDMAKIITMNELDTHLRNPRVLIVGATSFIGFHLSVVLSNQEMTTKLIEDNKVVHTFDSNIIERIKKLKNSPVEFLDFSDQSKLLHLIRNFNPSVIVYVPTTLFSYEEAATKNKYFSVVDFSREFKLFFNVLKNMQDLNHQTDPHVLLLSISRSEVLSLAKVWFSSHERLLSSFLKLGDIQSSIIRVRKRRLQEELKQNTRGLYPNLSNMLHILEKVMKSSKNVFIDFGCSNCAPMQGFTKLSITNENETDLSFYSTRGPSHDKNIVMTTYFTNVKNPMHSVGYAANKFRFMRSWFQSCKRLGLYMVVFHDELSNGFQKRVKNYYSNIDFIKTSSAGASPNDKRFQIFANYILSNQEIQNVLLTDIRDVFLGHNPFEIMTQIGDYIFVGQDLPFFYSTSSYGFVLNKVRNCYGKEAHGEAVKLFTLFNAGVLGGSRSAMLTTLQLINEYLHKAPSSLNCNMPALAIVLHKHLYEQTFSGYPFNNLFGVLYGGSQGVAVMHKTGHRIYP